jgi:hypothetical protein
VVLINEHATQDTVLKAFREHLIGKADPETVVVLHYSGHGSQVKDDNGDEPDGWDETLVPFDSGRAEGHPNRDIIDDELGALLDELSAKTPYVTFIFDSCHSGDASRDIDQPREVARDERDLPKRPGLTDGGDGERNVAQISGCRADERSFEMSTEAGSHGAMTYYLIAEIQSGLAAGDTLRDVIDRVTMKVSTIRRSQHPQAEGNGLDREVFGIRASVPQPYIKAGMASTFRARVEAGEVQGMTQGSVFDVFPPGTKSFDDPAKRIARIKLVKVSPYSSEAELLEGRPIPDASRAVERVHRDQDRPVTVFLDNPGDGSPVLEKVRERLSNDRDLPFNFKTVGRDDHPQFTLRRVVENEQGAPAPPAIAVLQGDGSLLSLVPETDPEIDQSLLDHLSGWTKWQNLFNLSNPGSTALATISVAPLQPPATGGKTRVTPDLGNHDGIEIVVENTSSGPIYFAVLDLSSNGGISLVYPRQRIPQPLESGKTWRIEGTADIPRGWTRPFYEDHLIVVATQQPTDFRFLEQAGFASRDLPRLVPEDSLSRLLAQAAFGQREFNATETELGGWSTARASLKVHDPAP